MSDLNYKEVEKSLKTWLTNKVNKAGADGAVIGISGGIDSAVTAVLCKKVFKENTLGIILPCNSNKEDKNDAIFLADEFDIEETEVEIQTFRELLSSAKQLEDPNNVLTTLIEKAGHFLDMVERESVNGSMNARYMEVAAQLINSIITASNSISSNYNNHLENELKQIRVEQRNKELEQKDKELEIKEMYYKGISGGKGNTTNNNVIVSSREDILKFLQNKNQEELGE